MLIIHLVIRSNTLVSTFFVGNCVDVMMVDIILNVVVNIVVVV